jgi:YD repeat-containing protein
MKKTTFLLSFISVLGLSNVLAQSANPVIKTEHVQITDCSNSPIHFRGHQDDNQFIRFADLYNDFLENEKVFYHPDGRVEREEKYYLFIKPITETYTYHYFTEGSKETVSIKKDNVLEKRYITNPDNDEVINEEYHEGKLHARLFSSIASGEDLRAIGYDKEGKVVFDEQKGVADTAKSNYAKRLLSNGNTEVSYTDGQTLTIEVYNSKGEKISDSSFYMFENADEFINHNASIIHQAKPVKDANLRGDFNYLGIETEIQAGKKTETLTAYAEYVRNGIVYRTPEETQIRIYNQQGNILETVDSDGAREMFSYNEKDQPLEIKKVSGEGGVVAKTTYAYKNDLLTEIKVIDGSNNQAALQIALDYTFDKQGNWIKMTYSENGKCVHIKNRTLTYY